MPLNPEIKGYGADITLLDGKKVGAVGDTLDEMVLSIYEATAGGREYVGFFNQRAHIDFYRKVPLTDEEQYLLDQLLKAPNIQESPEQRFSFRSLASSLSARLIQLTKHPRSA